MIEPVEVDIIEAPYIRARPNEDLVLYLDFDRDMSGATHKLLIEEYEWTYAPEPYSSFIPTERDTFDTSDEVNGIIKHVIDEPTITSWRGKRLDIRWQVVKDGRTWIAADRSLAIAEGD